MPYEWDEDELDRLMRKREYLSYLRQRRNTETRATEIGVDPTDTSFIQDVLGKASEVAEAPVIKDILGALGSPQNNLAGLASYAAEALGQNKYAESGIDVSLTDLLAAPMDITGKGKLAQRGREFNEKVARSLNVAGLGTTGPVQELIADTSPLATGVEHLANQMDPRMGEFGGGGSLDDLSMQMGYETMTDPLMLVEGAGGVTKPISSAYNGLKATGVGRRAIQKFPSLLLPEKAWLKMQGYARKADILGKGKKLEDLYVAQQGFERNAGYEVEKFKQDVTRRYVDYLNRLKGLPEEDAARVKEALPLVVEYTDKATRANLLKQSAKRRDRASQLLYEMADSYADDAEAIKALENGALNLKVVDLADDINYFGRKFSPEVEDLIARHPDAREILFAHKMNAGAKQFQDGWLSWEKGRKLRGFDIKEAEAVVRDSLRKAGVPVPDEMAVFSRDAFGDLLKRADKSLETAKIRNLYQTFAETFGQMPQGGEQLINKAVQRFKSVAPNGMDAESMAKWFDAEFAALGKPPGSMRALDVIRQSKATLPDTPEEIARLAMTFVEGVSDGKKMLGDAGTFAKYANAHYYQHLDKPGKFWRTMDAIKGVFQKAVLARPGSLAKDFQGTMINGAMSGNTAYLDKALKQIGTMKEWRQNTKVSDLAARLRAEGVMRNFPTEVMDDAGGQLRKMSLELRQERKGIRAAIAEKAADIEELGIIGGAAKMLGAKKAGQKIGKATDAMVEARAYTEELNRMATYLKAIDEGLGHEQAIEEVYKFWGKFDEMTRLDKNVLSRVLFFWSWWARSIPVSVRHLLDRPVRSRLLLTMMAGNVSDDPEMPPWMQRMGGLAMGRDQSGNATVLNMGNGTYFSPLFSVLQGEMARNIRQGNVLQAAKGTAKDLVRSAPPYFSEPIGALFDYDPFTGKPTTGPDGKSRVHAPIGLRFLLNTPVGNTLGLREYAPEGEIRYLTIDPTWATILGMTPGLEPALTDASSFVDPRQADVKGELSLKKGIVRQLGVPLYSVPVDDKTLRSAREGQAALKQAILDKTPALIMRGDWVTADKTTLRGRELAKDWARAKQQAELAGLKQGSPQYRLYVATLLKRDYPQEYEYINLGEKLRILKQLNEKGEASMLFDGMDLAGQ